MEQCQKIERVTRFGVVISNKPQIDKAGQASPAFRQIWESGSRESELHGLIAREQGGSDRQKNRR